MPVAAFAAFNIERVVHSIQRTIEAPRVQIVEKGAAWGKVLGNRPPLASRAQNIQDPVHNLTDVDPAPVAADLGRWNNRFDVSPFFVGQVTATVIAPAVFRRPHRHFVPESLDDRGSYKIINRLKIL